MPNTRLEALERNRIRQFNWLIVTVVLMFISLVAIGVVFKLDSLHKDKQIKNLAAKANDLAISNTKALCTFRSDLDARIARDTIQLQRSRSIIDENPDGITIGNTHYSKQLLRASYLQDAKGLSRSRHTRSAFNDVQCPAPEKGK